MRPITAELRTKVVCGYRNHNYLLRKLRFMTANPIRNDDGVRRFLALGIAPPMRADARLDPLPRL
jgi:hypothetical protein